MNTENKAKIRLTEQVVSKNIKKRRIELGLSQQQVAEVIGVSIQQLQKYENCINRISSGKLQSLSTLLKTPISFFFDLEEQNDIEAINYLDNDYDINKKGILILIKAFNRIKKPLLKNKIVEFVKLIGDF